MDGQALEFPDKSFDAAILHLIVAVIPDPARCLKEVARVLRPGGRAVIFDKFVPDDAQLPLVLRLLNPLTSLFGTAVTRKLGPLLKGTGLQILHQEPAGIGGLFKISLLRKVVDPVQTHTGSQPVPVSKDEPSCSALHGS